MVEAQMKHGGPSPWEQFLAAEGCSSLAELETSLLQQYGSPAPEPRGIPQSLQDQVTKIVLEYSLPRYLSMGEIYDLFPFSSTYASTLRSAKQNRVACESRLRESSDYCQARETPGLGEQLRELERRVFRTLDDNVAEAEAKEEAALAELQPEWMTILEEGRKRVIQKHAEAAAQMEADQARAAELLRQKQAADAEAVRRKREQERRRKLRNRKIAIALVILLPLVLILPLTTKTGAIFWEHIWQSDGARLADARYTKHSVALYPVSDDFAINIAELHCTPDPQDMYQDDTLYCMSLGYRQNGIWRFIPYGQGSCHAIFEFQDLDVIIDFGDEAVTQLGRFTVISISDSFLSSRNISPSEVYDSLNTKPVFITSSQFTDKDDSASSWLSIYKEGLRLHSVGQISLKVSSYIYVVKDMPDDYVFVCGEQQITADEICQLLQ